MCFLSVIARKINLFERDSALLTKADMVLTYLCIVFSIGILTVYTVKYYQLAQSHIEECNKSKSERDCTQSEIIHLVVPYVGVVYGFMISLYKGCNLLALFINYLCCCYACCKKKSDPNKQTITEVELHTNRVLTA